MKKATFSLVTKQISALFVVITLIVFCLWNTNANAQNVKGKSEQNGKIINNVSVWKSNVQLQKHAPSANTNSQQTFQKTESTSNDKEVKVVNPEGYYFTQTAKTKQGYSSESKELIEKEIPGHGHL